MLRPSFFVFPGRRHEQGDSPAGEGTRQVRFIFGRIPERRARPDGLVSGEHRGKKPQSVGQQWRRIHEILRKRHILYELKTKETKITLAINRSRDYNSNIAGVRPVGALCVAGNFGRRRGRMTNTRKQTGRPLGHPPGHQEGNGRPMGQRVVVLAALPFLFRGRPC